jgi:ribose 5-phosphate isomerase A
MNDSLKYKAAVAALEEVQQDMVLGLGTGSTVTHFITELGNRVRDGLNVRAIATSLRSEILAREVGVPIITFADEKTLDLTVDGADEVSSDLQLTKGLGGALVREKLVARVSRRFVVVVDDTKLVERLGTRSPIPVEVVPFASDIVIYDLLTIGGEARLRMSDDIQFISDNGNHVVDWHFGPLDDPAGLEQDLKLITGVVDSGLFSNMADRVIVAGADGIRSLEREQ